VALATAGLAASVLALIIALVLAVDGTPAAARVALVGILTFFWATTVGAIGIVGVYIVRIYKDVRRRPAYILESTVGLSESNPRGRGDDISVV
jgi:dolichol-phosphate mannosyltransferase